MTTLPPHLQTLGAYGRRMQRSACIVEATVKGEFDPGTGQHGDDVVTVRYDGPCKVYPTGGARVVEFGEGPTTIKTYDVELEGPVTGVPIGATVRLTSSADPELAAGAELVVLESVKGDSVTNRRLVCEEAS